MDLANPRNHFADAFRQPADVNHALLLEHIELPLQLRNQIRLYRIQRDCRRPKYRILDEHENQDRERRTALERRQGHRVTNESAQRFGLGRDHGDHFSLGQLAEARQRETQDPFVKLESEPPQHAFTDDAAVDVVEILEPSVNQHQQQENGAEKQKIRNLFELKAKHFSWKVSAADGLVDNRLRQVQRHVEKRKSRKGKDEQQNLLLSAEAEDEAEDRRFHISAPEEEAAATPRRGTKSPPYSVPKRATQPT